MIVFSDFDDTLHVYGDEAGFQRNLKSIQEFRQKGNLFCLATGRSEASVGRVWPEYRDYLDYMILDNGAICLDRLGNEAFQGTIPPEVVEGIAEMLAGEFGDTAQAVFYHDMKEWREPGHGTTKIRAWTKDVAVSQAIYDAVDSKYGDEVYSTVARTAVLLSLGWIENPEEYVSFIDIMSAEAGKNKAIRRLGEKYPGERVITVGDGTNDLEMIQEFDGYAVKNSVPEVLEAVSPKHVVGSVSELLRGLI